MLTLYSWKVGVCWSLIIAAFCSPSSTNSSKFSEPCLNIQNKMCIGSLVMCTHLIFDQESKLSVEILIRMLNIK